MSNVCCIKGCDLRVLALGLCDKHWKRNRKYGSPAVTKIHSGTSRKMPHAERFWLRVKKTDNCWWWIGGKDLDGYGVFRGVVAGTTFNRAHRYSYALHTGDLLVGRQACHTCDNPSCVNPEHLFSGTAKDNMDDMIAKGRQRNAPKGELNGHAVLTQAQARAILGDARPYTAIAADYGVTPMTVSDIKNKHSWKHLDNEVKKAPRKQPNRSGENCYAARLTEADVLEIRASVDSGRNLAVQYGVSPQTITDIRKFRSWKHLPS